MNAAELTANLPPVICGDAVLGEDPSRCKFCREGPLECNCHIPVGNFAALLQDNFVCNSRRQDRDMLRLPRSPIRENKREMAANLRHPEDADDDGDMLDLPTPSKLFAPSPRQRYDRGSTQ